MTNNQSDAISRSVSAPGSVNELVARIRNTDDTISGPAWQSAEGYGAAAVRPLSAAMADPNFEIARNAKRALYRIVRATSRPGAEQEAMAVEAELIPLLKGEAASVRREVIWMLSEIGGDHAVSAMAPLLLEPEICEDARCAIQRIPGKKATTALRSALKAAPQEFRYALADSLRKRGETIERYPTQKLVPTRQTTVAPAPEKAEAKNPGTGQ